MTGPPQSHFLERFDEPQEVSPDPAVFEANLAALRAWQPLLPATVAAVDLPRQLGQRANGTVWRAKCSAAGRGARSA